MKKAKTKNVIIQYNTIGEFVVIAKGVDIHYSQEICKHLRELHIGLKYEYYTEQYFKANKDRFQSLLVD